MKGSITINQELCKGCLLCASFCPRKSLSQSKKSFIKGYLVAEFDEQNGCTGCMICTLVCPEVVIEVYDE